jgi:HK97 family phage prohead protease
MIHLRTVATELHIRDDRTLAGLAVPYGVVVPIAENGRRYREEFGPHSLREDMTRAGEIELTALHPRSDAELPIGVTLALDDQPDGLYGHWRVSATSFGDDVLQLVADKALRGLSVGFEEVRNHWRSRDHVVRQVARLDHIALVRRPAYATARLRAARGRTGPAVPLTLVLRRRA